MEEVMKSSAREAFENWVLKNKLFQKTPVYRNLLEPAVSYVLGNEKMKFDSKNGELRFICGTEYSTKVEVTITDINICSFHASVFIDREEDSLRCKKFVSIYGTDTFSGSIDLDMRIIRNIFRIYTGSECMADVTEKCQRSRFTADGLEEKREKKLYGSDYPIFTRGWDMILGQQCENSGHPIKCVPMKLEERMELQLSPYHSSGVAILPSSTKSDIVVCAKNLEQEFCFPYFHDEDGWIVTEPFMSDVRLQLPCVKPYTFIVQDRMQKCDIDAMKAHFTIFYDNIDKLYIGDTAKAPKLLLTFDPGKENLPKSDAGGALKAPKVNRTFDSWKEG